MSLINDALRRASQTEKNRPRRAATSTGMEPTPVVQSSRLSMILAVAVVVALLLAGWFFWQWWNARIHSGGAVVVDNIAPPVTPRVIPPPVAPIAPAQPAPAPVVVVPATPVVAPPVVTPAQLPNVANFNPSPWPVDLKLGGIFYSKTNPQALINGNIYGTGDDIQGVVLKKIERDKVTVEWNGRSRVLIMGGQ
jgi:hypothetical protein